MSLGLSARLIGRLGPRSVLVSGLAVFTAALALLTRIPAHAAYATHLLPLLVLFGLGGGLTLPAVTTLGMSGATDTDAGIVSGVFNTAQQVGGSLGVAVLTTLAAARTGSGRTAQFLTEGYHLAWEVGIGLAAASIVVAAIALRPRRPSQHLAGVRAESGEQRREQREQHQSARDPGDKERRSQARQVRDESACQRT